jgi:hypothetical protein
MGYKPRTDPVRFRLGEIVEIHSSLHTRLCGTRGSIVQVTQSRYAATLDKYLVSLLDTHASTQQTFWDIELKKVPHAGNDHKENTSQL